MKNLVTLIFLFFSAGCFELKKSNLKNYAITIISDSINSYVIDSNPIQIYYDDLFSLRRNNVNSLKIDVFNPVTIPVKHPVYLNLNNEFELLTQPKDTLLLKLDSKNLVVSSSNIIRNNEISFYILFSKLKAYPKFPYEFVNTVVDFDSLEKKFKQEIVKSNMHNNLLIDSLQILCKLNNSQIYNTNNLKLASSEHSLWEFYLGYKPFLVKQGLFEKKLKELLDLFNDLEYKIISTNTSSLNEYAKEVLPLKISSVKTQNQFELVFDSICSIFKNNARGYLLSELMLFGYSKQIAISKKYYKLFRKVCNDCDYKKIIANEKKNYTTKSRISNEKQLHLISVNEKKIKPIDLVLDKYQGKYVLLDFWATWCAPCREELPYLNRFIKDYKSEKIEVVKISIDRDNEMWRNFVVSSNMEANNQFNVFRKKDSLYFRNKLIETIPRYILLDMNGEIVNDNLPSPKTKTFRTIIDSFLSSNRTKE